MPDLSETDFSFRNFFNPLTNTKAYSIIAIVGLIVFFNMLFNGFVLDDKTFIVSNPAIHSFNLIALIKENIFNSNGRYQPLLAIYFSLLYPFAGNATFIFHLLQLILHIADAILLFILFSKFFNRYISLALSLIFLVHPLQVESVSYIAATENPLFLFFGLLALLQCFSRNITPKRLAVIFGLLLLSVLSQETGFLFLLIILLYGYFYKRKFFKLFLLGGGVTVVLYAFIRFIISGVSLTRPAAVLMGRLTLSERLIDIPAIIFYYLKTIFFPVQLVIDQQWTVTAPDFQNFYFPLLIDLAFFAALFFLGKYIYKKRKQLFIPFSFFTVWFLLGIVLHLQLFPLDATVADRWLYFPFVGFLGIVGFSLQLVDFSKKQIFKGSIIAITLILLLLSLRTIARNTNWYDAFTLYSHDSKIQTNYDIENGLAIEYAAMNDYPDAIAHYKNSVAMYPDEVTFSNLAYAYEVTGNYKDAEKYYQKILNAPYTEPRLHAQVIQDAYERLAWLSLILESPENAEETIQSAIHKYPNSGKLWEDMAICEYKLHNQKIALSIANRVYHAYPNQETAYVLQQISSNGPINIGQ